MDVLEEIDKQLKELGVGRRSVNDPFFNYTHKYCKVFERKGVTVEDEEELCHELLKKFPCNACSVKFDNLLDYELHYHDLHHFVCSVCDKWRPTARLLEIHVQETHDSFFQVMAEKQSMYQCFVSECNVKFKDPLERRVHCREVHVFPKNYRFDQMHNNKSKKVENKSIAMETNQAEVDAGKKDKKIYFENRHQKTFTRRSFEMTKPVIVPASNPPPEKKMPPVTMFIPRQVQQKSFAKILTNDKRMEKNVLESESIMELGDSLPNPV